MWSLWMKTWWNLRSRERTKRGKKFTTPEMAGRFSFFEEVLLGFEVQNYTRVAAAVQKAVQCYCVVDDGKKRAIIQPSADLCFKRVDSFGSSKSLWHWYQVWVTLQLALRLLLQTILPLYQLPPPLLLPSVILLACSCSASSRMPAVVLDYSFVSSTTTTASGCPTTTFQGTDQ